MTTSAPVDAGLARKAWRTLEPYHGMIYFAPDVQARYDAIGLRGWAPSYFGSRAAALGPVPAEVVMATFFNFHPSVVQAGVPAAWEAAAPERILEARLAGADDVLRRVLGDDALTGDDMAEGASLARAAAEACRPEGRPLFAAHAALNWPAEAHLALWHAVTLLREFRGDGHVAALCVEGLSGCEALVTHGAAGDVAPATLQSTRRWPDDEWDAAVDSLRNRGWLDGSGALTDLGRERRAWIEQRTDELAAAPWQAIGAEATERLRSLVRPFSRAISDEIFGSASNPR